MILWLDNQGTVDITNRWATGGNTRHAATRAFFLRQLREEGLIKVNYLKRDDMGVDLFTKNLEQAPFLKHVAKYMDKPED